MLSLGKQLFFYRRRLRIHGVQELFAAAGVAVAVALVFAVTVANSSIASSAENVVRAVVGPADLQLHGRGPDGIDERALSRVDRLAGVEQAAPLLEQTATVVSPAGHSASIDVAGTNIGLALLDGLAHSLPLGALSPGGIGLSQTTAGELEIPGGYAPRARPTVVSLMLRGRAQRIRVSSVLGPEAAGALAHARVAVMPLKELQQLAGLSGRVSRILIESKPGAHAAVRHELLALAGGRMTVSAADQDVQLLHEALRPSNQASALFAGLSALLGFLFAFNAMLLTAPERRETIADLRLEGMARHQLVQMTLFQAFSLGIAASLVGLGGGYLLSLGVFDQSPGYLTRAFTLGTGNVIGALPVVLALGGGLVASCLASIVPLTDLRAGRPIDAALSDTQGGDGTTGVANRLLLTGTVLLLVIATTLFLLLPSAAIIACVALAVATMLAVPLVLEMVLRAARALTLRKSGMTVLLLALTTLRATSVRALALAATGAVALFGSVALGSSRDDLLRGINGYTANYVSGARIWVVNPADNQAINDFAPDDYTSRVASVPGVASVREFQGSFLDYGNRRVWVIAWPNSTPPTLLNSQIVSGNTARAAASLQQSGFITISDQIASEHRAGVGDTISLPTPTGTVAFRVAATTTNFGWSPGAILMSTSDYTRAWGSSAPSALGVDVKPGESISAVRDAIARALASKGGLEVLTASARERTIDHSASEGLGQLAEIATLLVIAAILAMAAALGSSLWQKRAQLAEMRLEGAPRRQLRLMLLTESALMLAAGCLTGAVAGVYGQIIIDGYLKHVTGFPVASASTGVRPIEIFVAVIAVVLAIVAIPGWRASRVPATLALND